MEMKSRGTGRTLLLSKKVEKYLNSHPGPAVIYTNEANSQKLLTRLFPNAKVNLVVIYETAKPTAYVFTLDRLSRCLKDLNPANYSFYQVYDDRFKPKIAETR